MPDYAYLALVLGAHRQPHSRSVQSRNLRFLNFWYLPQIRYACDIMGQPNTLYYGDNLSILRSYIASESVDLVYLDPPFNSNRTYNVLFKDESGQDSEAQIAAFEDTWHWNHAAEETYAELATHGTTAVSALITTLRGLLGTSQMMAYLVMMTARLVELHRVLKPTGSLYLHCDPTASHYLRILLDTIFDPSNFLNQIVWRRSDTHNDAKRQFPAISDHILVYSKTRNYTFHKQHIGHSENTLKDWYLYLEFPDGTIRRMTKEERETQQIPLGARRFNTDNMTSPNPRPNLMYVYKGYAYPPKGWRYSRDTMEELDKKGLLIFPSDPDGRIMRKRYLDEQPGAVMGDVWVDISQIRAKDAELLGYPTQKPLALLERIINASSNPEDIVLDPFCGCGTAIAAAQKLGRHWIGIDITHLSIALQKYRLKDAFRLEPRKDYQVIGEPVDAQSAQQLSVDDRYQFQWWALSLVQARPLGGDAGSKRGKKGADKGIDGVINFMDGVKGETQRVIVQVKSGHVSSRDIRDLAGTIWREKAAMGVFITLDNPSQSMLTEAATAGFYHSRLWGRDYPKLQILTITDLLAGAKVDMPTAYGTFQQAPKERTIEVAQGALFA